MKRTRSMVAVLGALTLTSAAMPAVAQNAPPAVTAGRGGQAAKQAPRRARAWIALSTAHTRPWVGQAVPVTVSAFFRGVEGVTLEGLPQLASKAIVTSDLAKDPHQSVEMIDGERTLVARWTATITPSAAGPLDLSVTLPVRIRYREAPPRVSERARTADPFDDDPFADIGPGTPFDAIFDRMRDRMRQSFEQPAGRLREEAMALKADAKAVEARDLPTKDRPASFTGAVGRFDLESSISATRGMVSEPLTLRVAVGGDVDLARVDLPGIASSADWKVYPPRVVEEAPRKGLPPKKVVEQVIVPLHGGAVAVPPVSFTSFDPVAGTYVTRSTPAIQVAVDGVGAATAAAPPAPAPAPTPEAAVAVNDAPVLVAAPLRAGKHVLPVLALVLAAAVQRGARKRLVDLRMRRTMRRAARESRVETFLRSARRLIATRLSERWGVPPEEVTAHSVQQRLGPDASPLVDVLVADEALRFGRGGLEGAQLAELCSTIEKSLRELREPAPFESHGLRGST